jgi:preprotein translocase subunit SecG
MLNTPLTFNFLLIGHAFLCICLVGLVLVQQGKGADLGASMGGSGSNSVFGTGGAVDFIAKLTTVLAIAFMCTSILLVRAYNIKSPSNGASSASDLRTGSLFTEEDETKLPDVTVTLNAPVTSGSAPAAAPSVSVAPAGVSSGAVVVPPPMAASPAPVAVGALDGSSATLVVPSFSDKVGDLKQKVPPLVASPQQNSSANPPITKTE